MYVEVYDKGGERMSKFVGYLYSVITPLLGACGFLLLT